jgi:integrase
LTHRLPFIFSAIPTRRICLQAGAPLPVIAANLGHADTRMTERHYAHLVPSHVARVIRATMPRLGLLEPSTVVPLTLGNANGQG